MGETKGLAKVIQHPMGESLSQIRNGLKFPLTKQALLPSRGVGEGELAVSTLHAHKVQSLTLPISSLDKLLFYVQTRPTGKVCV